MAMPPHAAQAHVARSCEIAISARLQDAVVRAQTERDERSLLSAPEGFVVLSFVAL